MTDVWDLPGPSAFLRAIAEDLRSGSNIALVFPEHAPTGWLAALRAELSDDSLPRLQDLQVDSELPFPSLHQHLGLGPLPQHPHVPDLCQNQGFMARLLHIGLHSLASCEAWGRFISDYEDACRNFSLAERTLLVVSIEGELADHAPKPGNLLQIHQWPGRIDGLDIRLYAAGLLASTTFPNWQRSLAVSLLGELALWDPHVCASGASRTMAELIEPGPWLAEIARERGWSPSEDVTSVRAERRGVRQFFEDNHRVHSAWLALASREDALAQRVWNAQVTCLFPILERQRRALLKTYGAMSLFKFPWDTKNGQIDRLEDLELTHIADQLARHNSRGLRDICDFVYWLRDLRNDLAHLSPIPAARLLHPSFSARLARSPSPDDL